MPGCYDDIGKHYQIRERRIFDSVACFQHVVVRSMSLNILKYLSTVCSCDR